MSPDDLVLTKMGLRFHGRLIPCVIGRSGLVADKREGDGGTPIGTHRITGLFYRPDRITPRALPRWAQPIGLLDLWCDAPDHPDYNQPVRAPFPASHEKMRRADPMYDLVLNTDWNFPEATPGKGSAIFLHTWRRPGYPTAGCLAFSRPDMAWIATRVQPGARIIICP